MNQQSIEVYILSYIYFKRFVSLNIRKIIMTEQY